MNIFEKREYMDGGPNDRGFVIGYIRTNKTREELRKAQGHGFIDYIKLSEKQYSQKKKEAQDNLKMFF